MTPEEFFQQMKLMFSQDETTETFEAPNTTPTRQIIAKPKKQYVSTGDILNLFHIDKATYNNLLAEVRFIMTSLKFDLSLPYKKQDITLISKVIERFKKRNPGSPTGEGCWLIKELIKKYVQHHRDYLNRKKNNKENEELQREDEWRQWENEQLYQQEQENGRWEQELYQGKKARFTKNYIDIDSDFESDKEEEEQQPPPPTKKQRRQLQQQQQQHRQDDPDKEEEQQQPPPPPKKQRHQQQQQQHRQDDSDKEEEQQQPPPPPKKQRCQQQQQQQQHRQDDSDKEEEHQQQPLPPIKQQQK